MNKGIFLDRDGTLVKHVHYLAKPEDIAIFSDTIEFIKTAQEHGYLLFLFTNQSGIGRGYFTLADVEACNQRMIDLIGFGDVFQSICIAPEKPEDPSLYRKPSPRFILEMIDKHNLDPHQTWMLGDSLADLQAGINAKIHVGFVYGDVPIISEDIKLFSQENKIPHFKTTNEFFSLKSY